MSSEPDLRLRRAVTGLYYVTAAGFFLYLLNYYLTGEGGPTVLAVAMVPVAVILFVLEDLRKGELYPQLGWVANHAIAGLYIVLAIVSGLYLSIEFFDIRTVRAGFWSLTDVAMGSIMVVLIMEYVRRRHFVIFVLNVILMLYAVYGWIVPGMFHHPGLSWERVATAMSVETTTGVFSRLPQLALTLIGSFLLVLSALRAFGCVDSILTGAKRVAARSPHAVPQSAVLGSLGVAMVSGSGAANAATIGSATIPAMIASGMPRASAAAVETSASLGGQLMPPIMGISAFLMADFLGRSYFDVVARGYAPAIIYFASVAAGVYLLAALSPMRTTVPVTASAAKFDWFDAINLLVFGTVVFGLILLMGVFYVPAMIAALQVFLTITTILFLLHVVRLWHGGQGLSVRALLEPFGRMVDGFASMTADLTLLLAALSIMTGAFVITGIPTKIGVILIEAAGVNLAAMVLVAFVFGALLGTGLPPAPTYILTALVIAPPIIRYGVDPWAVHFFAFFLAVWGELTPPTSVVAAVTAKIADASFGRTLLRGIQLCLSLFTLMAGVFVRPELVVDPGWAQIGAMLLILVATVGLMFAVQARYYEARPTDLALRLILAALALTVLFQPNDTVAMLVSIPMLGLVGFWFVRRRGHAPLVAPAE